VADYVQALRGIAMPISSQLVNPQWRYYNFSIFQDGSGHQLGFL